MLANTGEHVISALRSKVRIIQASNVRKALQYLADTNLKGVFVADEGIAEKENAEVLYALIEWVNAGGIAVICSPVLFIGPSSIGSSINGECLGGWAITPG